MSPAKFVQICTEIADNLWKKMQVSLHHCNSNIRSWAHQVTQLVALILLSGAIKWLHKKKAQTDDVYKGVFKPKVCLLWAESVDELVE